MKTTFIILIVLFLSTFFTSCSTTKERIYAPNIPELYVIEGCNDNNWKKCCEFYEKQIQEYTNFRYDYLNYVNSINNH